MVQVENEFGSYVEQRSDIPFGEHRKYEVAILEMLKEAGFDVPFYTSDGAYAFKVVKAFMKQKGFTDMNRIQSYFNDNMLAFFRLKGKVLVGWDEIIEGGIDSSAVMMFWRPWAPDAPLEAAKKHNNVVMSPDGPL